MYAHIYRVHIYMIRRRSLHLRFYRNCTVNLLAMQEKTSTWLTGKKFRVGENFKSTKSGVIVK